MTEKAIGLQDLDENTILIGKRGRRISLEMNEMRRFFPEEAACETKANGKRLPERKATSMLRKQPFLFIPATGSLSAI
jgi:hypothetical protein